VDRRRFIEGAGALGAGLVLAPTEALAAPMGRRDRKIAALEQEIAVLQAEIAALRGAKGALDLGIWPGSLPDAAFVAAAPDGYPGVDTEELLWWETFLGRAFSMYRERGRVGQFDAPMVKHPEDFIPRRFSGNLNFRTGLGADKTAVPYADVLAGSWDDELAGWGRELAALGAAGINEIQSEANIGHGGAQPSSGTPAEYQRAAPYVRSALRAAGATRILHGMSLTVHLYQSSEWEQYYWDDADFVAVDGYREAWGANPNDVADFQGAIAVARQVGRPLYITEIGASEPGKDAFFEDLLTFAKAYAGDPLAGIVFNLSADGPSGAADPPGWAPVTSDAALAAFRRLVNDPVFAP